MKKIFVTLIIFLFSMQSCFAITDVSKKLSLTEAIELGLADNPQNLTYKKDVEIAGKEVKIADKLNNPSIFYTQNMGNAGVVNPQQLGISYEMELFKRLHRKRVAKANLLSAEHNFKALENQLVYDIKEAYFELLYKKANLKIYEQQKEVAKTILANAEKEAKRGKIAKTDVVLAKIEYNRTLIDYNQAEFEVISAKNKFNSLMNTHSADYDVEQESFDNNFDVLLTVKPTEDLVSFEDVKNYTFTHRHDLLDAQAQIKSATANLGVVKSQLIPNLGLEAGWLYFPRSTTENHEFHNGTFIQASLVNIPLIYQYKPEIQKAKLEIEKAELNYKDLTNDVTRQLTEAWERFVIARNNLNFYNKELLKNSQELSDVAVKSLMKNEISMADYLVAKKMYIELLLDYNQALNNYFINYALLLKEIDVRDINTIKSANL